MKNKLTVELLLYLITSGKIQYLFILIYFIKGLFSDFFLMIYF